MSEETQALQEITKLAPMTLMGVKHQVNLIQQIMREEMKDGEHYGVIPGCPKPSLWKPGAEKLCLTFRMAPRLKVQRLDLPNGHREITVTTELHHINSEQFLGEGVGSCSTMESKYRYRDEKRKCPKCGKEAIIKGKAEYGGGWVCFTKKDGCGAKFADSDKAITDQKGGKTENPDIADVYNTVLKIAKKRSLVDAVLTVTAASDIFTQDLEDLPEEMLPAAAKVKPADKPSGADKTINEDQQKLLFARITASGIDKEEVKLYIKTTFGKDHSKDLTMTELAQVIKWLEQEPVS